MKNPTYAEIEQMSDPNEIAVASATVAAAAADGTLDLYEASVTLALLDTRSQDIYTQNAHEIAIYESYADVDTEDSSSKLVPSGSWLGRVYDDIFKDDDE